MSFIYLINLQNQNMSERHRPGYLPWDRTGNRLLIQSSLGKTKPSNYEIPNEEFIYGRVTPMDPEHAEKLMYSWKYHQNSDNPNIGKKKDFLVTNKKAITNLLHTAAQNYNFRKTQTFYQKVKEGSNNVKILLPQQNFTYGRPGDLQDPVKLVIANEYGEADRAMRNTMYQMRADDEGRQKRGVSCHITKNHNLKKQATARKMAEFQKARNATSQNWKLAKFTNNAKTKIDDKWLAMRDKHQKGQAGSVGSSILNPPNQELQAQ